MRIEPRPLSLALQRASLLRMFPGSQAQIRRSQLVWLGQVTPSALSAAYTLRLHYTLRKAPRIYVVEPELKCRGKVRPPHIYDDMALCLYLPWSNEWGSQMCLSRTILPWASEWLIHYEAWLFTGEWQGRGVHLPQNLT